MVSGGEQEAHPAGDGFIWTSRRTISLIVVCVAQALDGIDVTVVNVALPTIAQDVGISPAGLSWVVNAYMVMFGGFLLLGGRAGDLLGRRRVFLAGVLLFTAASLGAGLADDAGTLIAARGVQGLAAALIAPMSLALIAVIFPEGSARNKAMAIWGSVYGASSAVGLVVGGLLVSGPGWRWIFLVNVPIGVLVLAAGMRWLRADDPVRRHHRFDVVGAVTSTAGAGLLAYAVLRTEAESWGSPHTVGLLVAAVVLIGYFVVHETLVAAEPLIPVSLFRNRVVTAANLINAVRGSAMFAMFYFATLYLQQVLRHSPLETGLAYLPLIVVSVLASAIAPLLVRRLGTRIVVSGGSLIAAVGSVLFTRISPDGSVLSDVIVPSLVLSLGLGLLIVPLTIAGLTGVAAAHSGAAAGLLNVSLQLGGALGLTVLAATATDVTAGRLANGTAVDVALTDGFRTGFAVAAALMVASAVAAAVQFRNDGRGRKVDLTDLMSRQA